MTWASPMLALIAAAIAVPALVILYFLKLRRQTREVSSTLLWKKTIQDLQANAPFQKLRKNLLLFLQLIILGLILIGLAQPRSSTTTQGGRKLVLLIDRSASMASVDGEDTLGESSRLDRAKRDAVKLVESMRAPGLFEGEGESDEAMVIAFDTNAEILVPMSSDQTALINAINSIDQTDSPSSIDEAYRLAQAQRPNRYVDDTGADGVTNAVELEGIKGGEAFIFHLFSDGQIPDAEVVRADNQEDIPTFEYHGTGKQDAVNIGLIALRAERDYDNPRKLSVFVGVQSTDSIARRVDAELIIDGSPVSVRSVELPPAEIDPLTGTAEPSTGGVVFELEEPNGVMATVQLDTSSGDNPEADLFATDNRGTLIIPPAKQAAVALVTTGNFFIREAFLGFPLSRFQVISPSEYESSRGNGAMGAFDLVVFDGYLPKPNDAGEVLDPGRYLILGAPLVGPLGVEDKGVGPGSTIIDWRRTHPILRDLTLDGLVLAETRSIEIPEDSGVVSLAETATGTAIFETSNADVRAICVPFDIGKTNWPFEVSFIVFLASTVDYLATQSTTDIDQNTRQLVPGAVLSDRLPINSASVRVRLPDGSTSDAVIPSADGSVIFGPIRKTGVYQLRWAGDPGATDVVDDGRVSRFYAANLLDADESNIRTLPEIALANRTVGADASGAIKRTKDWWPWLLMGALAILMLEWWIYNRKMYL